MLVPRVLQSFEVQTFEKTYRAKKVVPWYPGYPGYLGYSIALTDLKSRGWPCSPASCPSSSRWSTPQRSPSTRCQSWPCISTWWHLAAGNKNRSRSGRTWTPAKTISGVLASVASVEAEAVADQNEATVDTLLDRSGGPVLLSFFYICKLQLQLQIKL